MPVYEEHLTVVREGGDSVTVLREETDDQVTINISEGGNETVVGEGGIPGPPGPPGPSGQSFVYEQSVASDVWVIPHNLGFPPNISCFDSAGTNQEGVVDHLDANNSMVTFLYPIGGKAVCS